jgi:transposase
MHRDGWSYRAIARQLWLDRRTVKTYVLAETFPGAQTGREHLPGGVKTCMKKATSSLNLIVIRLWEALGRR